MNWYKQSKRTLSQSIDTINITDRNRVESLSKLIDEAYARNDFSNIEKLEEELETLLDKIYTEQDEIESEGYDVEG